MLTNLLFYIRITNHKVEILCLCRKDISKMKRWNRLKMYVFHISCIIIFLLMIYFSYDAGMRKNVSNDLSHVDSVIETTSTVNKTEENKNIDLDLTSFSPDVDLEYYREYYNNNEIVARLEIPNLFNLMITKTTNNEYYLDHSIDRNSNIEGTEFMDFRVTPSSKQINIYGHNSLVYDVPFKKLENYLNESFYQMNQYIILQHDSGRRIYQIFSFKRITTDYEHMKVNVNDENFVDHLTHLQDQSIYTTDVTFNKDSNLLVLQTCTNDEDNSYYILSAIEI